MTDTLSFEDALALGDGEDEDEDELTFEAAQSLGPLSFEDALAMQPTAPSVGPIDISRPILFNPDDTFSTEESITVTDLRLNNGRATNIPSIVNGQRVSEEEAVQDILRIGLPVRSFETIPEAVDAARARSEEIGRVRGVEARETRPRITPEQEVLPVVPTGAAGFEALGIPTGPQGFVTRGDIEELQRRTEQRGLEEGTPLSRIVGAARGGAVESLQLDRPLGLAEETEEELRELGIFSRPENRFGFQPFNLPRDLLELGVGGVTEAGDAVLRAIDIPFRAGIETVAQIGREAGMSKTQSDNLRRELENFLTFAGIQIGVANPELLFSNASNARRGIQAEVRRTVDEATDDLPPAVRASVAEESVEAIDTALDNAMQASVDSKIGTPTVTEMAEGALREELGTRTQRAISNIRTDLIDGFDPIRLIEEIGRKAGKLPEDLSPYTDFRLLAGLPGQIQAMQRRGTFRWNDVGDIEFSGEGLIDVFADVKNDIPNVTRYFAGRRAAELTERGIETGFTADEIRWMSNLDRNNPQLATAFDRYQEFQGRNLQFAEQSDLISVETLNALEDAGRNYVPFYREMDAGETATLTHGSPLRSIEGSDRNIAPIMENINRNAIMWTVASFENRAKVRLYDMLETMGMTGEGGVVTRIRNIPESVIVADDEVRAALMDLGVSDEGAVRVFGRNRMEGQTGPNGNPIDVFYRKGERQLFEVNDPLLYKAIQHTRPGRLSVFTRWFGGPVANLLRAGVTMSPDFIAANMVRDTTVAFSQSRAGGLLSGPASPSFIPGISTAQGLIDRMRLNENYWMAMANGAGFGTFYQTEFALANNASDFYRRFGISYENQVLNTPEKIGRFMTNTLRSTGEAIETVTSVTEQASRIREFTLMQRGGQTLRQSALGGRDVATDFSIRGQSRAMREFTAMVPFLNARIQGLDRMVRRGVEDPARVMVRSWLTQTIPALVLYQSNRDNPDYQALPDWVRDQHHVIFTEGEDGESTMFLIPRGFEFGAIFAAAPERMMQSIEQRHGRFFVDFLMRTLTDTLAVGPPQFASPVIDVMRNETFSGRPVVPADLENVRSDEQYRPYTNQMLVQAAQAMREETGINISPMEVQHLIQGYTGTIGSYMLSAADMLVRDTELPTPRLDEVPVVRRFTRQTPLRGTQFEIDFYDLLSSAREQATTQRLMERELRDITDFTERERRIQTLLPILDSMSQTAGLLRRQMRVTQADPNLSGEQKRERIDEIQGALNELFEGTIRTIDPEELRRRGIMAPPPREE